jgi:hypothetical protein
MFHGVSRYVEQSIVTNSEAVSTFSVAVSTAHAHYMTQKPKNAETGGPFFSYLKCSHINIGARGSVFG